jgi:3-methyladenine DNA glycosylase AlkD
MKGNNKERESNLNIASQFFLSYLQANLKKLGAKIEEHNELSEDIIKKLKKPIKKEN